MGITRNMKVSMIAMQFMYLWIIQFKYIWMRCSFFVQSTRSIPLHLYYSTTIVLLLLPRIEATLLQYHYYLLVSNDVIHLDTTGGSKHYLNLIGNETRLV